MIKENKMENLTKDIKKTNKLSEEELKQFIKTSSLSDIFRASIFDERIDQLNFESFRNASKKIGENAAK